MQKELKIVVTAPCDCTEEQFEEWIRCELNEGKGLDDANPLWIFDLKYDSIEFLN